MNPGILTQGTSPVLLPGGLLGSPTPVAMPDQAWHPEALDWRNRVRANGGDVSHLTMSAVNQFCTDIDAAALRDRFYRLNLFCGSNLSACLVPLYRGASRGGLVLGNAADVNNNFVAADYVEYGNPFGGLKGNGSNKDLNTGFNPVTVGMSALDCHLAVYSRGQEAAGSSRYVLANTSGGGDGPGLGWLAAGSLEQFHAGGGSRATGSPASGVGFQGFLCGTVFLQDIVSDIPARNLTYALSGSVLFNSVVSQTASFPLTNAAIRVFSGGGSLYTLARYVRGYSIGLGLNRIQIASYNSIMQRFQAALGRSV